MGFQDLFLLIIGVISYSLIMSKFKFANCMKDKPLIKSNIQEQNSQLTTPKVSKEKGRPVSPFPGVRCPSPLQKRLASSPLHVPLAIALKRLVSASEEYTVQQGGTSTNRHINRQVQNIKNVLQQFAESLYISLQRQLYSKFNLQMKRIILRYRDVQKLIVKVQQKIIINADVIQVQHIYKKQLIKERAFIKQMQQKNKRISELLSKSNQQLEKMKAERDKLRWDNERLAANVQKLEYILLKKLQEKQNRPKLVNIAVNPGKKQFPNHVKSSQDTTQLHREESLHILSETSSQMSNSYITNINQIAPTLSPISRKKAMKARVQNRVEKQMVDANIRRQLR